MGDGSDHLAACRASSGHRWTSPSIGVQMSRRKTIANALTARLRPTFSGFPETRCDPAVVRSPGGMASRARRVAADVESRRGLAFRGPTNNAVARIPDSADPLIMLRQ